MAEAPTGYEPELGGELRSEDGDRTGFEPELGGALRQNAVYVDESVCIGCGHCAYVARHTFFLERDYGRARVIRQDGDGEETIQEAIDTCPVDCIAWVNYGELAALEAARRDQVLQNPGLVGDGASLRRARNARNSQRSKPRRFPQSAKSS